MSADFHILLVEDSRADVKIIGRALAEARLPHRLTVLPDGRSALDYLRRLHDPAAAAALRPDLVLLDLNLPGLDGGQVLARIKSDPLLKVLPVVVLTTSTREEDVRSSYEVGANTFIAKPGEYDGYRELVRTLAAYWGETAMRPALRLTSP